jgi:hypothetical protein
MTTAARACRSAAVVLVVAGWLAVLDGLFLLPPSRTPARDLEAGPAFDVNLTVYLPSVVLTGALAIGLLVAVLGRAASVTAGCAAAAAVFALWVSGDDALCAYLPGLRGTLLLGAAVEGAAVPLAVLAIRMSVLASRRCRGMGHGMEPLS